MLYGARVCLKGRVEVCRQSDGTPGCQFCIGSVAPLEASGAGPAEAWRGPVSFSPRSSLLHSSGLSGAAVPGPLQCPQGANYSSLGALRRVNRLA